MSRINYAPGSYAPRKMEGLLDDLWTSAKDVVGNVSVGDVKLTDVLPSASDVASATKQAATTRLQQSINKALGTGATGTTTLPKPAAPTPSLPPVQPGAWDRAVAWAQENPVQATIVVGVTVWGIKQLLKKRR